jgi:asparagine synthase (glutamine-hydrolysing)
MKYQLGLLHRGDRQATPEDLALLLRYSDGWSAEVSGAALRGPLAIAYRGARITQEEDTEVQPVRYGPYILTFDGRLDNREDIAGRISLADARTVPDPEIVVLAYEKYGDGIFPHLVGEFALVLWCEASHTLLFARSVCGTRPLYYVLNEKTLIWSSDFAHLVRISGVGLETNDSYMLEYLVSQPSHKHSPLLGVHVVQAGTVTRFANDSLEPPTTLWDSNEIKPVRYHSDAEYEEALRNEIRNAVRVRMRANKPVFCELSGGFDSSTLALTADSILRCTSQYPQNLKTVSCVFEESESCDERYFMRSIEEKRGISSFYVYEKDQKITLGLRDIRFTGKPNPLHCFSGRYPAFAALMNQHGARVLFSGEGGDHLFWSIRDGTPVVAEELRKGNIWRMLLECGSWSRVTNTPYFRLLLKSIALTLDSVFPGWSAYEPPKIPPWLATKYRVMFEANVWDVNATSALRGYPGFRAHYRQVASLFSQVSAGYLNEYADIYVSYPYTYRPLVEFCLGLPISQSLRNGETRSLMRRALRDILPDKIVKRQSKGGLTESLARALDREWEDLGDLHRWELSQREFINPQLFGEDLRKARLGLEPKDSNVLRAFSLERWLRSLKDVPIRRTSMEVAEPRSAIAV